MLEISIAAIVPDNMAIFGVNKRDNKITKTDIGIKKFRLSINRYAGAAKKALEIKIMINSKIYVKRYVEIFL